ncbi:hypothetical protein B484DRAFT_455855 [Ochromonadaceae sp. CCMP2298]|nr:hypothetical protein B484DRAFT_455855 [Ochromonadaceae sp. CCMP2298]|mmetsp:Transcript_8135/g.18573  ORF Transcript_8135/g.18573 Transcript_8135/m.18573 type:complete len:294 (+) Transcript_8135:103-984(+)
MGAAASMEVLYGDSLSWFKEYFDTDLYMKDFEAIDKDDDGGLSYEELSRWITWKAKKEMGPWKIFTKSPEIIRFSHEHAATMFNKDSAITKKKVVGLEDFRSLLIHMYAVSVLWVHFKNADDCVTTDELGNLKLNMDEFNLAVKTLCASKAGEHVTEAQIEADFLALDLDQSESIGFVEVCAYCCRYIDPSFRERSIPTESSKVPAFIVAMQVEEDDAIGFSEKSTRGELSENTLMELNSASSKKVEGRFKQVSTRNHMGLSILEEAMKRDQVIADFVEVKVTTQALLDELLA